MTSAVLLAYSVAIRGIVGRIRKESLLIDEKFGPRNLNIDLVLVFKFHITLQFHVNREYR